MSSVQTDRRFTEQREIPIRRIVITDPSQIPRDLSSTPNGTIYCTTPGGTRIVYDRSMLLKLSCSPMTKTPPSNMKVIPGVTAGLAAAVVEPTGACKALAGKPMTGGPRAHTKAHDSDEQQFEMDI